MEFRFWQHQNGLGTNHTRKHKPVRLVFVEMFARIDDAYEREKQIRGWSRKKKEALIAGDFNRLHELAADRKQLKPA
uniref:GIY-YIG nuclease family protein n=1 Tax=Neisseria chenwenguii TaxID=1853278 RepID=UPI0018E00F37